MDELIKAVKSLISDIESMQTRDPNWLGPFSEYEDSEDGDGIDIEWPNLAISVEEVKKLLQPKTIEGDLVDHHQKALGHDGAY